MVWWTRFLFAAVVGFAVLAFRHLQALASCQLYWHPAPVRALLGTARDYADEWAGVR